MPKKKQIKAWAIVDIVNGKIVIYDRFFQNLLDIHPTKTSAIKSVKTERMSLKELGAKIISCKITYEI